MDCKRVLMIVNPRAGKMTFHNSFYTVVKNLSLAGYDVNVSFTAGPGDAAEKAATLGKDHDLIIACGGDGTLNETISGIMRLDKPVKLGYIPCGSTNDFASTLGIPSSPSSAVDQIIKDQSVQLDLGKFNDRYFTYTASFGAFTATSYSTPQNLKNALGHLAYVLNGAKEFLNLKPIRMKITTPEYEEEGEYIYGGITNTMTIGGVYSLPEEEVVLNDGKMELMMVRHPKGVQEYTNMLLNLAVRNYSDPNLLFLHTDRAVFESPDHVPFTLDGEYGGNAQKNEIVCLHKAYTVNGKTE